jgi:sugar/nucleoside kinase (ribokinase family)
MTASLVVIGDITVDVMVRQSGPLVTGSDTPSQVVRTRGGSAANTAAVAAKLLPTTFIGCVGDDGMGRDLVAALRAEGVTVRAVVAPGVPTGTVVILVAPDGERTMLPDRGANAYLGPLPDSWVEEAWCLHLTAYSFQTGLAAPTCLEAARAVQRKGGLVSLDVSTANIIETMTPAGFEALVAEIAPDIVFANSSEAALLRWDVDAPADRVLVVKHGRDPVLVRLPRGAVRVPVTAVSQVVDSTGAGDAFAAGFLAALLLEPIRVGLGEIAPDDPRVANWCLAGHAMAVEMISKPGGGLPI